MLKKTITIINKLGLHARASAKFVACAHRYASDIELKKGDQVVNGKSIMGVMMLAASQNTALEFSINGDDEQEMLDAITALIDNRFGEAE